MDELERLRRKVAQYERFLHALQMSAEVNMDPAAVRALIGNACDWSYAHRRGNGEYSPDEQQALIDGAFENLLDILPK